MFLMSQSAISAGLGSATDIVRAMLERVEAEVVCLSKWEERKLAYTIEGQKRGTFLLALFKVKPTQITNIERDCNLSEDVLRVMMTRADYMGETEIEAAIKAAATSVDEAKLADEQPAADDAAAAEPVAAEPAAAEPVAAEESAAAAPAE